MTDPVTDIDAAVAVLRRGGLVAFPTETVYGLGADAANPDALHRLYRVKRRPLDHPVIVHIAAGATLDDYARDVPDVAHALAGAFWPGTAHARAAASAPDVIADAATGGRPTVGLRVPDHPVALALLDAFGGGIAAPSANRFGRVSPTTAAHVRADLGADVDLVLDGGPSRVGVESTIVDVTAARPAVLRVGGIERGDARTGRRVPTSRAATPARSRHRARSPAHYAPDARVEVVDGGRRPRSRRDIGHSRGAASALLALARRADGPGRRRRARSARATSTNTPVFSTRGCAKPTRAGLDVVLAVAAAGRRLGVAVVDRLQRASADPSDDAGGSVGAR